MSVEITGLPHTALSNSGETKKPGVSGSDKNTQGEKSVTPPPSDSITITSLAEKMVSFEAEIKSQSVVDEGRVEDLKLAIDTGQYNINPLRVAEKFILFESQFAA